MRLPVCFPGTSPLLKRGIVNLLKRKEFAPKNRQTIGKTDRWTELNRDRQTSRRVDELTLFQNSVETAYIYSTDSTGWVDFSDGTATRIARFFR